MRNTQLHSTKKGGCRPLDGPFWYWTKKMSPSTQDVLGKMLHPPPIWRSQRNWELGPSHLVAKQQSPTSARGKRQELRQSVHDTLVCSLPPQTHLGALGGPQRLLQGQQRRHGGIVQGWRPFREPLCPGPSKKRQN